MWDEYWVIDITANKDCPENKRLIPYFCTRLDQSKKILEIRRTYFEHITKLVGLQNFTINLKIDQSSNSNIYTTRLMNSNQFSKRNINKLILNTI